MKRYLVSIGAGALAFTLLVYLGESSDTEAPGIAIVGAIGAAAIVFGLTPRDAASPRPTASAKPPGAD